MDLTDLYFYCWRIANKDHPCHLPDKTMQCYRGAFWPHSRGGVSPGGSSLSG